MRFFLRILLPSLFPIWLTASPPPAAAAPPPLRGDVVIVVNKRSADSRALGRYYARKRGIPSKNICAISVDPKSPHITPAKFETDIRDVIDAFLVGENIRDRIRFLVLSMDIPTRVGGDNSITGALFYGYKPRTPGTRGCDAAPDSDQPYYLMERCYIPMIWSGHPTPRPLPFMLAVPTLAQGKKLVDRSVAADGTCPNGVFCLFGSGDAARNVRKGRYPMVEQAFTGIENLLPTTITLQISSSNAPIPTGPVLGCSIGAASLPGTLKTNATYAPGAIAEHLTSCGGMLPDPCYGQSSVWDWFALGAVASYGTVSEPCNFTAKFPDPMLYFWYARGFTAGEALWMSVKKPYQGLFAGDPLCAPFAIGPKLEILSPPPGAIIRRGDIFKIRLSAADDNAPPPVYLDLYADGRHLAPIARPILPVLNEISIRIGTTNLFTYTIAPDESLIEAVAGLAWAVNRHGQGKIKATAFGDRLEVRVSDPFDENGRPLAFAATTTAGAAQALYITAAAGRHNLAICDKTGHAAALFRLGNVPSFDIEYRPDFSSLPRGNHILSFVARDGSARQTIRVVDCPYRLCK